MRTPNELRIDLANSQRTAKGRENWLDMALDVNERECWSLKSEHEGQKIGDLIRFTDTSFRGNSAHISMKEAKAFAFGENSMLVVYRGNLRKINIKVRCE